jgi:hypothetical protein
MELKNFKLVDHKVCKARFTLVITKWGEMEIDCVYFELDNGQWWINTAAKEYQNAEGKKKYWNMVRWPKQIQEQLLAKTRELVKLELNKAAAPSGADCIQDDEDLPF